MRKASVVRLYLFYLTFNAMSNLVHPITPAFLQSINCPDYMFGLAFAAMSFTSFLSSPFWGKVGDNIGYTKTLAIGFVGYGVGQYIFSLATGPVLVVVGRACTGLFTGAFMVSTMAYLASSTDEPIRRARLMAFLAAGQSVGQAVGFLIGGVIGDYNMPLVFTIQVVGVMIPALCVFLFMSDFRVPDRQQFRFRDVNPFSTTVAAMRMITPALGVFLLTVWFSSFSTNAHDTSFNYYLRAMLDMPPSGNGIFKAAVGIIALIANFTINMWITAKTDPRKSIVVVLGLCGISELALIFATTSSVGFFLGSALVFYTFNCIYLPIQQALVVKNDDGSTKGAISGVFNAARSLGMVTGSLFAGFAFNANPLWPFWGAAILFLAAAVLSAINRRQYDKQEAAEIESGAQV